MVPTWLLRLHRHPGSHVPYNRLFQGQPTCMPDSAPSVPKQVAPELIPRSSNYRGFNIVLVLFDTRYGGSLSFLFPEVV